MAPPRMVEQHGVRCLACDTDIYSNSRHDFVPCACDALFIDGGFDYMRVGFDPNKRYEKISRTVDRNTLPWYFREERS